MTKIRTKLLLTLALFLFSAVPALAAQVTTWSYSLSYSFDDYWNQDGNQNGLTPSSTATTNSLSWGDRGESSIGFITKTGNVQTGSTATIVNHMYHDNQRITGSYFLQSGEISAHLALQGIDPYTGAEVGFNTVLEFLFFETDNQIRIFHPEYNNDVFVLLNPSAATQTFDYDGFSYTFSFLSGFASLDADDLYHMEYSPYDSVLDALDQMGHVDVDYSHFFGAVTGVDSSSPTLYGWTTREDTTTYKSSQLSITSNGPLPAPEPSTFVIFGLGIAGLALFREKFRN